MATSVLGRAMDDDTAVAIITLPGFGLWARRALTARVVIREGRAESFSLSGAAHRARTRPEEIRFRVRGLQRMRERITAL